jgi:beta-glucosidase
MPEATHTFPASFLWGTATAGYQMEGQSTNTDFWQWEQVPGHILGGRLSGNACDWWNGRRWQEDFDRAAADGHNALRLSVEWSRVQPERDRWDEHALDHYRQMVQGLRQRGLTPMVTLHHFVNPLWATEPGHHIWETGEVVALFEQYARKVVAALGEFVDLWCTINEPNAYMAQSWVLGVMPPSKKDIGLALKVAENILRAHAAAYRAIHDLQPQAMVGLPVHFDWIMPARPGFALDEWAARTQFNMLSTLFGDALATGRLRRPLIWPVSVPEARGTQDFIGIQYYTGIVVRFDPSIPGQLFGRRSFPPGAELDVMAAAGNMAGYASYPAGLFDTLNWVQRQKLPIFITENGIGDSEDSLRRRYLISHLLQLWRAVNFNWDVRGYFHWSLLDNFEWDRGWEHRFGLYALDPDTQVRTARPSARLYSEIARSHTLSSDMVTRYAPELKEQLFPG